MKIIAFVALLVALPLVAPQEGNVGTCTLEEISDFVGSLPNGAVCGPAVLTTFFPSDLTPPDGPVFQGAVEATCHPDCGGALSQYYTQVCNSLDAALVVIGSCLNGGPSTNRCRYSAVDLIDQALINNLGNCVGVDGCPAECASALLAFVSATGCCFQSLYNNTELLYSYVALESLTAEQAYAISNITDPNLWTACDVEAKPFCTGEIFSGESELIVGNCTLDSFEKLSGVISGECVANVDQAFTVGNDEVLEDVCTAECGRELAMFERNTCQAPAVASLIMELCRPSEGSSLGDRCYNSYGEQLRNAPFFLAAGACLAFDGSTCPDGCVAGLNQMTGMLGCCYQNLYNNTQILDYLVINGSMTVEERFFFGALAMPTVWEVCGVSLVQPCSETAFVGGAIKFVASAILVFLSAWLSLM